MSDDSDKKNEHATALAALGAAKGGVARAEVLTPVQRKQIARRAAAARWGKDLGSEAEAQAAGEISDELSAEFGSTDKPIKIGSFEIPCYVLSDKRRVLVQRGLQLALGMSSGGGKDGMHRIGNFLRPIQEKGIDIKDLIARTANPIPFRPAKGSPFAYGYEATILADLCEVVLEARREGKLNKQADHIAKRCEILMSGFARVGIIALVDEATGYQEVRARNALAEILEAFVATALRKWVKTFPTEFYKELFRLRGWHFDPSSVARPALVGKLTDNIVYQRLAPGVRDELRRLTPRNEKGRLKHKLFQRLTDEIGHPKLREHIQILIAIMKGHNNWDSFIHMLDRSLPKFNDTYELPL